MGKRTLLLGWLVSAACTALAQKPIDGMVAAERSFAAMSVREGARPAFLAYIDSSAILFDKGKPVNGQQLWQGRPDRRGILDWAPQYAEMAASGDFGYTTGPWTYQAAAGDSVAGRGQFATVWRRHPDGTWKFVLDFGVGYDSIYRTRGLIVLPSIRIKAKGKTAEEAETDFIRSANTDCSKAYSQYLSATHCILLREGRLPVVMEDAVEGGTPLPDVAAQFRPVSYATASSGDLAYVYGIRTVDGKDGPYVRFWRREKSGWKIALDWYR